MGEREVEVAQGIELTREGWKKEAGGREGILENCCEIRQDIFAEKNKPNFANIPLLS